MKESSAETQPGAKVSRVSFDPEAVDDLLSRELRQLSFHKRSVIQEEIHGVRDAAINETPETVQEALREMSHELDNELPVSEKTAYLHAKSLNASYVTGSDFQLRFLRSTLFDAAHAARKLVGFLDLLLEYYGIVALQRPIRLSDLGKDAMDVLRAGQTMQMLPFRDRSGRRIVTVVGDFGLHYDYDTRVKVYLYMFSAASDDIETQRRGIVFVIWPGPTNDLQLSFPDPKENATGAKIFASAPIRICAMHFCLRDGPVARFIRACLTLMVGKDNWSRIRFDAGEGTEILYKLMGYGIPVDLLPLTDSGNVKTKQLMQWIKIRKAIEVDIEKFGSTTINECPFKHDVIIRFGKAYTDHPGTIMFRSILERHYEEHYMATSKESKVAVTWKIVEEVQKKGGRFLVWDNRGWWVQINDRAVIRAKVAVSMKDHTKRIHALQNVQSPQCSTYKFERQDLRKRKRDQGDSQCCGNGCDPDGVF
ncbi:hypothetical protein IV203_013038 [Nitzschia inconspicua]|uniref:DUF6824 domain-containing protein n=1 Tax=Nitzschia inconspicua TaxID=303405 RepID=A0A9K3M4C8_9STRA|nr:hypothetical protein IV203_013038 [Nitzschia inconspicua]